VPADVRLQQREELLSRPVVNVYDLASPLTCNVFANRQAMVQARYWEDGLALEGLLAHEHAHPLSECPHTAALRKLRMTLELHLPQPWAPDVALAKNWAQRANQQFLALAVQLFSSGPREVFTNTIAAEAGFDAALLHLNRQNIANLAEGLQYRPALAGQLAKAVAGGQLSAGGAEMLRLIGDMQAFLPLAMEIAPFRRAGRPAKARALLKPLHDKLLPHLESPVAPLFDDLAGHYARLNEDASPQAVQCDVEQGLQRLAMACAAMGATLKFGVEQVQVGR
jgi:hypothetical protein